MERTPSISSFFSKVAIADGNSPRENSTSTKALVAKGTKRRYQEDYIEYGFIASGPEDAQVPFCLLCCSTLSNGCLVPSKLKRHLETNHPLDKDKARDFFEKLASEKGKQSKKIVSFIKLPVKGQLASYKIAQLIAKRKKAHTEAELIIAPALEIVVETMLGSDATAKVKTLPL